MISLKKNLGKLGRATSIAAAVSVLLLGTMTTEVTAADKIKWKVQATFNTGWPALGDPAARLSKTLKAATDGRINLKISSQAKLCRRLKFRPRSAVEIYLPPIITWHMIRAVFLPRFCFLPCLLVWNLGNMQLGGSKEKGIH